MQIPHIVMGIRSVFGTSQVAIIIIIILKPCKDLNPPTRPRQDIDSPIHSQMIIATCLILSSIQGIFISRVVENAQAAKNGLQVGDKILFVSIIIDYKTVNCLFMF